MHYSLILLLFLLQQVQTYFIFLGGGSCPCSCQVQPLSEEVCRHYFDKGESICSLVNFFEAFFMWTCKI